jgi:hypothetical protein
MLPNFLCIGAQKSGTTTLLDQLGRHPDIFMSSARETQFFLLDHLYSQGLTAYEIGFFQDWSGQKAVGEKTPEYLCDPLVPQRIHDTLGTGMRFVVSFRSPAQRAYSHYRHNFQQFWEGLGFQAALDAEAARAAQDRFRKLRYGYLDRGHYARQLERYLALFPRESFLFLVYERDIVKGQREALQRCFGFLDVDTSFMPPDAVATGRAAAMAPRRIGQDSVIEVDGLRLEAKAGDLLLTRPKMKPRLIRSPSAGLLAFARGVQEHLPQSVSLDREQELAINRRYFAEDIRRLETLIGTDLGSWLD